jgi:CubicO group peptidase (beta-lactamase class C family)
MRNLLTFSRARRALSVIAAYAFRRPFDTHHRIRWQRSPRAVLIALLVMVSSGAVATPRVVRAQSPKGWQAFTRLFQTYVDSDKVVGATVVAMKDGHVTDRYDTGMADRARNVMVDSQTIFHWGSITKSLTAISIMQLRDRGKLSLDDKLVRWVPELRTMHDPYGMMDSITLRMVLSHTAGFQNPTWPYGDGKPWEPFEPTTWNQLVAMMPYQELLFKPGERYSYSNPGFVYLARVIEQISGDPWDAYVQKNIFAPLGLDRSYFRSTPYFLAAHRAHNYYVRKDSTRTVARLVDNGADFDPGITSPNGAWNAPVNDLVKYTAFMTNVLLSGTTRERYDVVLSRASLEEMWKPGKPMSQGYESSPNEWMGLSFFVLDRGGQKILGHTGSQAGFRSFYYFDPINKRGVVAVFNTTNYAAPADTLQRRMQDAAIALLKN